MIALGVVFELLLYLVVLGALATIPLVSWLIGVIVLQMRRPRGPAGT